MKERFVVLVEPEIPENTGFVARLCANFGYDLRLVKPEFNLQEARGTASSAQQKLRDARIYESVDKSVEDINFIVGTKPGRGTDISSFTPSEETSIMIGRESSGLTDRELGLCDAEVHIPTESYASINQSHAAAVFMQRFSDTDQQDSINPGQKNVLQEKLPEKVFNAVMRSNPSEKEVNAMIGDLK